MSPVNFKPENKPESKGSIIPASAHPKPEGDATTHNLAPKIKPNNMSAFGLDTKRSLASPPFGIDHLQLSPQSFQYPPQPDSNIGNIFNPPAMLEPMGTFTPALSPPTRKLMEDILNDATLAKKFQRLCNEQALNSYLESLCWQMAQSYMLPLDLMPMQSPVDIQNWRIPQSIHELAVIIGHETEFDYFTCLISVICVISICLCGRFKVRVKDALEESVNLYCLLIGPSGMRKSAHIKRFKKIIVKFIEERQHRFDTESPQQDRLGRFFKKIGKKEEESIFAEIVKECRLSGGRLDYRTAKALLESKTEELDRIAEEMRVIGNRPQYLLDVGTRIGLIKALHSQGGCGAILSEEPGWLLKIMDSPSLNEDVMINTYDMERVSYHSSREKIILDNPCLNILSALQLGIAADVYNPHTKKGKHLKEQGFMARFMPIFIRRRYDGEHYPPCPHLITEARFHEPRFSFEQFESALHEMLGAFFTEGRKRKIEGLNLSAKALENLESFAEQNEYLAQNGYYRPLETFLHKLRGMACRIAGVIHVWSNYPEWSIEISGETMALAINIAATLIPHAEYAFNPSGLSAVKDAEKVEAWIKSHRLYVFTYRQALQGIYGLDKARLMPALDALQRANRIAQCPDLDKSRICVVNPQLLA